MKKIVITLVGGLGVSFLAQSASLQFVGVTVGDEGAPIIRWASESNAVYRVDYAPELKSSNTFWQVLYEDYPSHGTDTFWMDNGDYTQDPPVKRPKDNPMRFYRVVKTGTNSEPAPFVQVALLSSNAVVSDEIIVSVTATSALPVLEVRLFVDGLEIPGEEDGTNFVINTCEWANGSHTIFATAKAASGLTGFRGQPPVTYGRSVSSYVPVTFSNYVSQLYFSEPFFEPALGQTQIVTAVFGAYSDWALEILDEFEAVVRTATGSGQKMSFAWDGTGDGGAFLSDGVYEYRVTATETTPPAPGGGGAPPSPMMSALASGATSYLVQPPPMPPVNVGGKWLPREDVYGPLPAMQFNIPASVQESYLASVASSESASGLFTIAATTPKAPKKPPVKPAKNAVATFGIAYWTYANGQTNQVPPNGIGGNVALSGSTAPVILGPVTDFTKTAGGFIKVMSSASWKIGFHKYDTNLQRIELVRSDLYGGSNLFNRVNLGLFMSHGDFGTTLDFSQAAGQSRQTYFPAGGTNPPNTWIRLSDFRFGDNLRWIGLFTCFSLEEAAYQTMFNMQVLPIGDQNQPFINHTHIMLGCRTLAAATPNFGQVWAQRMKGSLLNPAETIKDSWFSAGRRAYTGQPATGIFTNALSFKAVGWDVTLDSDTLRSYTPPDPSVDLLEDRNQQVYP